MKLAIDLQIFVRVGGAISEGIYYQIYWLCPTLWLFDIISIMDGSYV